MLRAKLNMYLGTSLPSLFLYALPLLSLSPLSSLLFSSPRCSHSFLRLVEKSSVVNGNSGFIVPRQTMPGNIIKTFRRNILTLTHRFTVRQTFRSSTPPLRLRPRLSVTARLPALPLSWLFMSPPPRSVTLFAPPFPVSRKRIGDTTRTINTNRRWM